MTNAIERWLPVVGWEGFYEVSNLGRIKSLARETPVGLLGGVLLKPVHHSSGYFRVSLHKKGSQVARCVHLIVAEAFIGPRPLGMDCCHCDGNKGNNCALNLRWGTRASNEADKVDHGTHNRGQRNGNAKLASEQVLLIRRDKRSSRAIAPEFGISHQMVSRIKRRKAWAHVP